MSKGLEALESIIETFYDKESEDIQIVRRELKEKEKKDTVLEVLRQINFDIVHSEQFDEWTLFITIETQDGECLEPVAFGSGKKEYNLLKEVLMNEKDTR